jgi:hypothetical protein
MTRNAHRLETELRALEACADRARTALACVYSSAEEFEAALARDRRSRLFTADMVAHLRTALAVTAGAAVVALIVLAL